jgi:hypothetical protein
MLRLGSLNKSALLGDGFPYLKNQLSPIRIAEGTNSQGETVLYVHYVQAENYFLITSFVAHPSATEKDVQHGGDVVDALLECEARLAGITALYILLPGAGESELVRTYSKAPQKNSVMGGYLNTPTPVVYIN